LSSDNETQSGPQESETSKKTGGRGKKSSKGHTYQKGKSCIMLGQKHNYKLTPSGKSMRCTKCGSTRWVGKAKKAKKGKSKKDESDNGSQNDENQT